MVPERSIGGSFADEPLSQFGFYWDWQVAPQWNLCNAPGVAKSKVDAMRKFLEGLRDRSKTFERLARFAPVFTPA